MSVDVTWWGHAACTVEVAGHRVLTDPTLTAHVAHLSRPGLAPPSADARRADAVLVSHLHADHLHLPSLRLLGPEIRLIVPRGAAGLLRGHVPAREIDEVAPGDRIAIGDVDVDVVPAHHDGHRWPRSSRQGPALGYVLRAGGSAVWFAGDTGLFDGMRDIGPVDVALVPVGGWGPTLGPEHLDPTQAADAVRRVGARHAVPIHYGTLWTTGLRRLAPGQFARRCRAPGREFAAAVAVAAGAAAVEVRVLAPGETASGLG